MAWLNRNKSETVETESRPVEPKHEARPVVQPEHKPEFKTETKAAVPELPGAVSVRETTRMVDKIVNIGQSIQIKGELTGNEDLTIEGKVDGKIILKDHNLTIGANGRIMAEVMAKTVVVVGEVVGNITADDKVEVAPTGSMKGDIIAPRVVLADGARFKGSIDMDRKGAGSQPASGMGAGSKTSMPEYAGAGAGVRTKSASGD